MDVEIADLGHHLKGVLDHLVGALADAGQVDRGEERRAEKREADRQQRQREAAEIALAKLFVHRHPDQGPPEIRSGGQWRTQEDSNLWPLPSEGSALSS